MTTSKLIDYQTLKHLLSPREEDAHKGDFGHVLVVGGEQGFGGAIIMAAEAAARSGAGLVSVATHPNHLTPLLSRCPEIMGHGIKDASELSPLMSKASVIVIGPGLGQSQWSKQCLAAVLKAQAISNIPLVIDADALNLLSQGFCKEFISELNHWILTPHPGEASRLLACNKKDIQANRLQAAEKLQKLYGGVCILKGSGSLIAFEHQNRLHIEQCSKGNPGMSTGGMGDILSGILGGLLAQHFSLSDSARIGVCLHAESADNVAAIQGERGMLATDLLPFIPRLMNP